MTDDETYRIRRAERADLATLRDIELAAASLFATTRYASLASGETLAPAFLAKQQEEGLVWVLEYRDEVVGFAAVHRHIDGVPFLEEMSIRPEHTRRRRGGRLLETTCAELHASGAPYLALTTFDDVPWNAPFYASHGFRRLQDGELTEGLRRRLEQELALYPGASRVVMRRDF